MLCDEQQLQQRVAVGNSDMHNHTCGAGSMCKAYRAYKMAWLLWKATRLLLIDSSYKGSSYCMFPAVCGLSR